MGSNEMAALVCLPLMCLLVVLIYLAYRILRNPFHYPQFYHAFDVSRRRNVDIVDYIDNFLCDNTNWHSVTEHEAAIKQWKADSEQYLQTCGLKKLRIKQYRDALNDEGAFIFETKRKQTRYKQRNYIKTPYKTYILDQEYPTSWEWLSNRHESLAAIGFETTLKAYNSKNQRRLVTKTLRKKIMARDHYTCQICGKFMPDEVGLQIDHIVPVAKGGKSVPSNLRVLCSKCNGRKGSR